MKQKRLKAVCLLVTTVLTMIRVENIWAAEKLSPKNSSEEIYRLTEQTFYGIGNAVSFGDEAYFGYQDPETLLYGMVSEDGKIVLSPEYAILEKGDNVFWGHQIVKTGKKVLLKNVVYDSDLHLLSEWESPNYVIRSCNDGIAAYSTEKAPEKMIYRDVDLSESDFIDPESILRKYEGGSAFHNGYAVLRGMEKKSGKSSSYLMDREGQLISFTYVPLIYDKEAELQVIAADKKKKLSDSLQQTTGPLPISEDWWVMYDESALPASAFAMPDGTERSRYGFYNLYARQNYLFPEGYGVSYEWKPLNRQSAGTALYVKDGYAVWSGKEQRLFDICRGRFAMDESYSYLELADVRNEDKHMLCQTTGGQWGYLNDQFLLEKLYDKAASFCGGYAAIVENGKCSVINAKFEKVYEDICEAEDVRFLGASDAAVYFAIADGSEQGACRILTVPSEKLSKTNPYKRIEAWKEQIGSYVLTAMMVDGRALENLSVGDSILTLKKNGSGELVSKTQVLPLHWDGKKLYLESENIEYQFDQGKITLEYTGSSGKIHAVYEK